MEVEVSGSKPLAIEGSRTRDREQTRVKRQALQTVLDQCQRALELLKNAGDEDIGVELEEETDEESSSQCGDSETAELCDLLKSRLDSPNFLEKLENAQVPQNMAGMHLRMVYSLVC
uniref:Uncharacterized protein n=1 Tax=Nelumbo nucifera TaxID=4432 RepID=A0A822ZD71_NELNU|nr:TPA_asm: hypothetical protein HUJ06_015299 [Nelumbo nucifera]